VVACIIIMSLGGQNSGDLWHNYVTGCNSMINMLLLYLLPLGFAGSAEKVMAACSMVEQMRIIYL
jgi:hypothetical protein